MASRKEPHHLEPKGGEQNEPEVHGKVLPQSHPETSHGASPLGLEKGGQQTEKGVEQEDDGSGDVPSDCAGVRQQGDHFKCVCIRE